MEENTNKVIYETHDRFPKIVYAGNVLILSFNRQNLNLVKDSNGNLVRLNKSDSWICVLTDDKLIELARKHKSHSKSFWEINKIPTQETLSITRSGPGVSGAGSVNSVMQIKEMKEKAMRLGELKAKLRKADGSYFANVTPNQIEELEKLEKELNE